jgi:hypothetical protein
MSYFVYYDVTTAVVFLSLSYGWLKLTKKLFGLHHFHNVIAPTVIWKRISAYWWCILVIDSAVWWTLGKLGKLVILISFPNVNRRFTLGWRVRTRLCTGQERDVVLMGWLCCWRVLVGLLCEFVRTTWWELIEWKESCARCLCSAFGSPAAKRDRTLWLPSSSHSMQQKLHTRTSIGGAALSLLLVSRVLVVMEGRGRTSAMAILYSGRSRSFQIQFPSRS